MYHDFLPPTLVYPGVGFPYYSYPCTMTCGLDDSRDPHSVPLPYHLPPTTWGMYHGHFTPFKG